MDMRKKVIAGNWKMNKTPSEAKAFLSQMAKDIKGDGVEVVFCVPAVSITTAVETVKGTDIGIGAENMYFEEKGAYTGEIAPDMLNDAGAGYVIIGHSERRQYFKETDSDVNKKAKKAIEHSMVPIICCGETLGQREAGETLSFVDSQIKGAYQGISGDDALKTIIAYEPIWAIGTGKVATSEQAQEVCAAVRKCLAGLYGQEVADKIRILYGGSMNAGNAAELLAMEDIDGGLIGGASLKPEFVEIVNAAVKA
jgi:triosephosphate isomerase